MFQDLPKIEELRGLLTDVDGLSVEELAAADARTRWLLTARPSQLPPYADWQTWLVLAGRGFGKTRLGVEWCWWESWTDPESISHVIAPTHGDLIGVCFEGPAGFIKVIPKEIITSYVKSPQPRIKLSNGSEIVGFSATEPDRLRGPQCHRLLADEAAAWTYGKDTWDMAMFGLRLGDRIKACVTTTPKPVPLIYDLKKDKNVVLSGGSSYENRANLGSKFFEKLREYEGTKLGDQEIYARVFNPEEAGIVKRSEWRLWPADREIPPMIQVILSLDTAFTEETRDRKSDDPDFTACGVWGVFFYEKKRNAMLLDAWQERLGLPDLVDRVKKELTYRYGGLERPMIAPMFGPAVTQESGRSPDMTLIEEKGSGISLRQFLARAQPPIHAYAYNPGRVDKLMRLHLVSPLFAHGCVWVPESKKRRGEEMTWATEVIHQVCSFHGEGTIPHDDHVDQTTQVLRVLMDKGMVVPVPPPPPSNKLTEREIQQAARENPYGA